MADAEALPAAARPLVTTLRSRAYGTVAAWLVGVAVAVVARGDVAYLLRVATGLEPRLVTVPEVLCVMSACVVPALAFPRLHSWEQRSQRPLVRVVAAVSAVAPLAILGCLCLLAHWVHDTVELGVMQGAAVSTAIFGAAAHAGVTFFGRTTGSITAAATYFAALFVQALQPSFPLPATGLSPGATTVGVVAVIAVAVLHYAYLGHRSGAGAG